MSDTPRPASEQGNDGPGAAGASATGAEAGATVVRPGANGIGESIGAYKLLEMIGEGGFGTVYMAQQSAPVKRRVALKILKPGMDSKQVIGRFEAERQAVAMMDHPNIARVFDAGMSESGRPFFVMELVRGVPITEFCDGERLSTRERLELFVHVCHAVQHAHQKGIIHRDLKPSNVLVTMHDSTPVPKVIDFGIAKALHHDLSDRTVFTEFHQFIGTPEYMSPEQAEMSGLDIDTRSDVYTLGVMLYELLAGCTPLDSPKMRSAGFVEIQRMIREEEPPRPSTRLATRHTKKSTDESYQKMSHMASRRKTDVPTLRTQLRGDLDWIIMKALDKDRKRRYDTAQALADDIVRYMRDEVVQARPPSLTYRARKFARRNSVLLGAVGGVISALLLVAVALGYGLWEARFERNKTAERETMSRAEILLSAMDSVRHYTANHVRPALVAGNGGDFVREMVPGFSARMVFEDFTANSAFTNFVYKEAALNPTNQRNKADTFEESLLEQFRGAQPPRELRGVRPIAGASNYYIARPMKIGDARCLDCHTTPDVAPAAQVSLYGREGGYGWKLGEVIATQVVYVPVSQGVKIERGVMPYVLGGLAGAFVLTGLASLLMLRRRG